MNLTDYVISGLRGMAAAAFLSCATLATRPYTGANDQENAYLNMRDILVDNCCDGLFDSYPNCAYFKIDQQGFLCGRMNTVSFTWEEIEQLRCEEHWAGADYVGSQLHISGKYDSNFIWTGLQQCKDLEKAMRIYLQERKK